MSNDVKRFMAIRYLDDDGETERAMHCRAVAEIDYDALLAENERLRNAVRIIRNWCDDTGLDKHRYVRDTIDDVDRTEPPQTGTP